MNQTLDKIRRALYHDETFLNDRDLIKGIRWLLLKNNKNLNDERKNVNAWNNLMAHRTDILNGVDFQISTGPPEGFNNEIKVLKRRAYGTEIWNISP